MLPRPQSVRAAVLVSAALLLGACPDTPSSDPDTSAPAPSDADAAGDGGPVDVVVEPDLPAGECQADGECTPSGALPPCRVPACVDGACTLAPAEDGAACDDGDACTDVDACFDGACVGESTSCDDDNPCTTDACDPAGGCVHTFNQKPCDDGDACTVQDHCFEGACEGQALTCEDGNPCTEDACDPVDGCSWTEREGLCEDGDACTDGDTCVDGACQPGPPTDCGEGNPCVDASCDPTEGCQVAIVDGDCDDEDACTTDDHCEDGVCTGGLVVCDDGNPCTSDYCDPASGCQFTANQATCDDGDACTLGDQCAEGVCVPGEPDPLCCDLAEECDDGDLCTTDACTGGYCEFTPLDCSDGFICTADSCVEGVCANVALGPLPTGAVLTADFEGLDALDPWTIESSNADVTWQLDTSEAHAGQRSLYVGSVPDYTYDHGVTLARASRSVEVPVGSATLRAWVLADLSEASCSYDVVSVLVEGQTLSPEVCDTLVDWTEMTWDLSGWAGQTVTLEMLFDTGDGVLNTGRGVWVDDLAVEADNPPGCCLGDADCAAGSGCLAEVCDPEARECAPEPPEIACDDADPCTTDACDADGTCLHEVVEGCCSVPGDCPAHPSGECAVAACDGGTCSYDTSACP